MLIGGKINKSIDNLAEKRDKESAYRKTFFDAIQEAFSEVKTGINGYNIHVYQEDLDPSLWAGCDHWVEKLYKLEPHELESFKNQMIRAIEEAQKKKKEKQEKESQDRDRENQEWEEKSDLRSAISKEINNKFFGEPYIYDWDLDSSLWSPYPYWQSKLWKIEEIDQLENFKKQMLAAIDKAKEVKKNKEKERKEELDRIFAGSKNQTGAKLDETINNVEKEQGSQTYEDNKEKIEELKKRRAAENPKDYQRKIQRKIREKMESANTEDQDLTKDVQKSLNSLSNDEIKDPTEMVKAEMLIIDEIEKSGATKKLTNLLNWANQVLDSASKQVREEIKTKISEFVNDPNFYCQFAYHEQESEVKKLLNKLEKNSPSSHKEQPTTSPHNFPWKIVLPIAAVLLVGIGLFALHQKSLKHKQKKV